RSTAQRGSGEMQPPRPPAPPMMPGGCGMKGAQGKMGPGQMPGMQFMGRPPLGMPMGKGGLGMLNGMGMMPGMQGMMQGMPGMQGQMVMPPLGAPGNPGFQLNGCKGGGKDGGKFGGKDFGGKDGGKFGCGKDGGKFGGKDGGKGMMGNDNGEQSVADALVSALNALGPPPSGPCGCGPPPGMPGMTGPRPNGMGSMPGMMMQLPPGMLPPPPGILPPGMMPGMMPPPPGMMPPGFMNMPMPPGFDGQLTVPILPPGGQEGGAVGGKQFPWEGTSGVQCKYARACKNSQCTDEHLDGRDIDKDPNSTICRFGRKCKRQGCFFVHPQGRDIDDDPSKGMCRQGIGCKRADCLYAHPEERKVEGAESRACHICGLSGHIMKDCTKARRGGIASLPIVKGQYVEMTKFPDDWQEMGTEKLTSQIAAELEVFGTLSLLPTLVDGHNKAIAAFEEDDAAQAAVDALASVFSIALCEPPKPADLGDSKAGSLLITDFPARWQAADIGALLHGSVKPSMLIGIDMIPEEEGKGPAGRVRFRDFGSAREAAKELQGQKVAGKPLSITLEDEDGSPQDINAAIEDSRNDRTWGRDRERGSGGMELCQDYRMDRCTRGDRCKFSHGEEDSERKREMLERERKRKERGDEDRDRDRDRRDSWKDRDRGRDRSRSRDRDRSRGRGDDRRGGGREKAKIAVLHIDELAMPRRPDVPPAPSDREVYVDPLPDEDLLDTCVNAFGTAEEAHSALQLHVQLRLVASGRRFAGTYTVQVKDRAMLAHSFQGEEFGPAQKLHGMTAVVHAAFIGSRIQPPSNTLLDIGDAFGMLSRALDPYRYQNLDDLLEFQGQNTTVEHLCRAVWDSIAQELLREASRRTGGAGEVQRLRIRIEETDVALAEFEAELGRAGTGGQERQIIPDMDGVLYSDGPASEGSISAQIRRGLEAATRELCALPEAAAQDLYERYGSTALGLMKEGHLRTDETVSAFYQRAYRDVNLSTLSPDLLLRRQLEMMAARSGVRLWLATNSPHHFVSRVLGALGLDPMQFHIVCPSARNSWANKPSPEYFALLPKGEGTCFFDDSPGNCRGAEAVDLKSRLVQGNADVMLLVADELSVVPSSWRLPKPEYLLAKETVDLRSLSEGVLKELEARLSALKVLVAETGQAEPLRILDIGAGMLSMLRPVVKTSPPGASVHYTAVDSDAQLLQAAAARLRAEFGAQQFAEKPDVWCFDLEGRPLEVKLRAGDLLQVLEEQPSEPYHLVVGCSILDLVDVTAVSSALSKWHQGSLLYFPIHYAGVTEFRSSSGDVQLLTAHYNDSLVARGQVSNVTRMLPNLGETIKLESSAWMISASKDVPLYRQMLSFMATNAIGYFPPADISSAVAAAQKDPTLILLVENADFLGQVGASSGLSGVKTAKELRQVVEFELPGVARVVTEELPPRGSGEMTVRTRCSAVSAGSELRVLASGLPQSCGEPLDTSIAALSGQAGWPIRYGYCLVGIVEQAVRFPRGTRVFCFHPHASIAQAAEADALQVPEDISDEDAALFASMETACSLVQDASPVLGDRVAVYGAGTIGSLVAAVLAHQRQDVTVFEPRSQRLDALLQAWPGVGSGRVPCQTKPTMSSFDVMIETSGSPKALASAVAETRRGGRIVVGSWYPEEDVSLPLGLRFHRSQLTLVSSQVSQVSAPLSVRWTKARRAELVWNMLRTLRPASWLGLQTVPVEDAAAAYAALAAAPEIGSRSTSAVQLLFTYK
ncbi:unnamed protein product, partial [Polarella glacialis]